MLIDINGIKGLDYIRVENGALEVGAATRQADLKDWPDLGATSDGECCSNDGEILGALDELLSNASREDKIEALIELGRFDNARKADDPLLHRNYRVCHAIWASKYSKKGQRVPDARDPYIIFSTGDE